MCQSIGYTFQVFKLWYGRESYRWGRLKWPVKIGLKEINSQFILIYTNGITVPWTFVDMSSILLVAV